MASNREYAFQVRMTRDEGLAMEQKARLAGLSKSEYARRRLVNERRTPIRKEADPAASNGKGGMLKREAEGRQTRARVSATTASLPALAASCPACGPVCGPRCTHYCHARG